MRLVNMDDRWQPAHFIGGHPVLDLANTVFSRRDPPQDNELLRSERDLVSWLHRSGVVRTDATADLDAFVDARTVQQVREVREDVYAVFGAIAGGVAPDPGVVAALFRRAAEGLEGGAIALGSATPATGHGESSGREAIPSHLALLAVEALFTLPRGRVRACPRCGWLFVDTSRGGRRRWCSMSTCGNREKARTFRGRAEPA